MRVDFAFQRCLVRPPGCSSSFAIAESSGGKVLVQSVGVGGRGRGNFELASGKEGRRIWNERGVSLGSGKCREIRDGESCR